MRERNAFFASVFTRELGRWKQANRTSQEAFAEAIGVEANMITRYKQGKAHPSEATMERICTVLGLENASFYPSTFDEKLKYDKAFLRDVLQFQQQMEAQYLEEFHLDPLFWAFLWAAVPELPSLLPSAIHRVREGFLFQKNLASDSVLLDRTDLEYLSRLQEDTLGYLRTQILKGALGEHLQQGEEPDTRLMGSLLRAIAGDLPHSHK